MRLEFATRTMQYLLNEELKASIDRGAAPTVSDLGILLASVGHEGDVACPSLVVETTGLADLVGNARLAGHSDAPLLCSPSVSVI